MKRIRRFHTAYNRVAGKSLERLAALSDGIFAVAMTLLVLDLRVPETDVTPNEHALLLALKALLPRVVTYLMSFLTLGIFWVGNETMLYHLERTNRHATWIALAFLSLVTLIPFSTVVLANFITFRLALLVYWANLFLLGIVIAWAWLYCYKAGLAKPDTARIFHHIFMRRVVTAQTLYAISAALAFVFNTYVSIGLIVLIQLNYAVAPKLLFRPPRSG